MSAYDLKCQRCNGSGERIVDEDEEICDHCEGYGYLLTLKGIELIQFLKRRGVNVSMSPKAEAELRGMIE